MRRSIDRVLRFANVAPFTFDVTFTGGATRRIPFGPVLEGPLFAVVLDPEAGTLVWPSGAAFDPANAACGPDVSQELVLRAPQWAETADRKTG